MAEGIQYDVAAVLKVSGGSVFAGEMERGAKATDKLHEALEDMHTGARQFGSTLVGLTAQVGAFALKASALAGGVIAAGATFATVNVAKNLSLLEDKGIQLSGVLGAVMEVPFERAQVVSRELFEQFRKDALTSAGETQNFVETAALIAGPILGAGKAMSDVHDITKAAVESAGAFNVALKDVGGQVSKILQGGAGADSPLFQAMRSIPALKIPAAEEFNKLDPAKKVEMLQSALASPSFVSAARAAGDTLTGLISTTQDLSKSAGGIVLEPVFKRAKIALGDFTQGVIGSLGPGGKARHALELWGYDLGSQFTNLRTAVQRVFPDMEGSIVGLINGLRVATNGGMNLLVAGVDRLASSWPRIVSVAREMASEIKDSADHAIRLVTLLGGGDVITGVQRAAGIMGAGRTALAVAPAVSGAIQAGQGAYKLGAWALGSGAGAAAGGVAAGTEAGAGAGAAATGVAAGGGAVAAASVAGVAAWLTAVVMGAIHVVKDSPYLDIGSWIDNKMAYASARFEVLKTAFGGLVDSGGQLWDAVVRVGESFKPFLEILLHFQLPILAVVAAWTALNGALPYVIDGLTKVVNLLNMVTQGWIGIANTFGGLVDKVARKLGIGGVHLNPIEDEAPDRDHIGGKDDNFVRYATGTTLTAGSTKRPPPNAAKQTVEVIVKFDLGDGDEDAIFLRTRRDIAERLKNVNNFQRTSPLRNSFR